MGYCPNCHLKELIIDSDGDIVSTITISVDDANSDDNYDSVSDQTFSVTNADNDVVQLIISEIMYNSIDDFGSDDEWIEIYNNNGSTVDLSDLTLSNSSNHINFTFPSGSELSDGEYITVALGSNGDGIFNLFNPFTPDYNAGVKLSGSLVQVNEIAATNDTNHTYNSSSTITLSNSLGTTVDTVYYDDDDDTSTDGEGYSYEIVDMSSDNSDTESNWQASANTGGSPGVVNSQSGDANSTGNTLDISASGNISLSSYNGIDISLTDLSVATGGSLTIGRNTSINVSNNFTNNGSVILESDNNQFASLIVSGTATGEITYNRYVNSVGTAEWDLIGSPVDGLAVSTFVSDNDGVIATNNSLSAVGIYDNSNNSWANYGLGSAWESNNFEIGRGYQMATISGGTMAFTGSVVNSNQAFSVINLHDSGGRRWNLVSNPYPSYLDLASFLNENVTNNTIMDQGSYGAVYGWNPNKSVQDMTHMTEMK